MLGCPGTSEGQANLGAAGLSVVLVAYSSLSPSTHKTATLEDTRQTCVQGWAGGNPVPRRAQGAGTQWYYRRTGTWSQGQVCCGKGWASWRRRPEVGRIRKETRAEGTEWGQRQEAPRVKCGHPGEMGLHRGGCQGSTKVVMSRSAQGPGAPSPATPWPATGVSAGRSRSWAGPSSGSNGRRRRFRCDPKSPLKVCPGTKPLSPPRRENRGHPRGRL